MQNIPGISILVINFNSHLLNKTTDSIRNQVMGLTQMILVNSDKSGFDASQWRDETTIEVVNSSSDDEWHMIKEGLKSVKSPYVLFIHSDEPLPSPVSTIKFLDSFENDEHNCVGFSKRDVINAVGEKKAEEAMLRSGSFSPSDLFQPAVVMNKGFGVAFRYDQRKLEGASDLLSLILSSSWSGRAFYLDESLVSSNTAHFATPEQSKQDLVNLLKNFWKLAGIKGVRRILKANGYYRLFLSQSQRYSYSQKIFHRGLYFLFCPRLILEEISRFLGQLTFSCFVKILFVLSKGLYGVFYLKGRSPQSSQKVCLVSHVLPPSPSGQSVVIGRLLYGANIDEYSLVCTRAEKGHHIYIDPLPVPTHNVFRIIRAERFYRFSGVFFLAGIIDAVFLGWKIARRAQQEGCNVLISCTGDLYDLPAAFFASQIVGAEHYPYYFDDYRYQWVDRKRRRFAELFEGIILRHANGVIVPNEFMRRELNKRNFVSTCMVRNPIGTNSEKKNEPAIAGQTRHCQKATHKIVYSGALYHVNISAIKRITEAISLIKDLQIELHLYSSQPKAIFTENNIDTRNIRFHSHLSPEEIAEELNNSDLLLLPFSDDSSVPEVVHTSAPGKLGEYLFSGTPIFAHVPAGSFVEWFLLKTESGIVANEPIIEIVASKLKDALLNDVLRRKVISNAVNTAEKEFSIDQAVGSFREFVGLDVNNNKTETLYISSTDLAGQRFNGFLLSKELVSAGFESYMSVAHASSDSQRVYEYGYGKNRKAYTRLALALERGLSFQSLNPFYGYRSILPSMLLDKIDLVHLQLIHAAPFFNLRTIPEIANSFPTVCTLHDQWLYTGHCLHPMECNGWLNGCKNCPDLNRPIAMRTDRASMMWKKKKDIFSKSEIQLICASNWMKARIKNSPILGHLDCQMIPFGIDESVFFPENTAEARSHFNISKEDFVIAFRAAPDNLYKGFPYILKCLDQLRDLNNITLVVFDFDQASFLNAYEDTFNLVRVSWVEDETNLRRLLSSADVFLSPSLAESFGVMPLEAMACGAVAVVFEDTALEEVVSPPEYGIAVPYKDSLALANAIRNLYNNRSSLRLRGKGCSEYARENYKLENYVNLHKELYLTMLNKG